MTTVVTLYTMFCRYSVIWSNFTNREHHTFNHVTAFLLFVFYSCIQELGPVIGVWLKGGQGNILDCTSRWSNQCRPKVNLLMKWCSTDTLALNVSFSHKCSYCGLSLCLLYPCLGISEYSWNMFWPFPFQSVLFIDLLFITASHCKSVDCVGESGDHVVTHPYCTHVTLQAN